MPHRAEFHAGTFAVARGAEIRQARLRAGLTQMELAQRSGVRQSNIAAYENGSRHPSPTMVTRLVSAARQRPSELVELHRSAIREIGAAHNAHDLRIFGSVAAGTDTVDSDLDLLATFEPGTSLFDVAALADELEALLGVHVDVVSSADLKDRDDDIRDSAIAV